MSIKKTGASGFTLIEIMVAMAVFAVLGILAYGGLNQVLKGQAYLKTSFDQLKDLQLAFRYFEKDMSQLVNRPGRNQYQDFYPAFVGNEDTAISFTHAGWRNPANLLRSNLQRVGYELSENTLKRHTWAKLDGALAEEYYTTDLLEDVESIELRYLDASSQWHTTWPPLSDLSTQQAGTPRAMELTIKVAQLEEIRRLFAAPSVPNKVSDEK